MNQQQNQPRCGVVSRFRVSDPAISTCAVMRHDTEPTGDTRSRPCAARRPTFRRIGSYGLTHNAITRNGATVAALPGAAGGPSEKGEWFQKDERRTGLGAGRWASCRTSDPPPPLPPTRVPDHARPPTIPRSSVKRIRNTRSAPQELGQVKPVAAVGQSAPSRPIR